MKKCLILPLLAVLMIGCAKKQEVNLDNLSSVDIRTTRYDLESVSFYNIEIVQENGNDKEVITDSARIDLKEMANGNIISIHSFWDENGYTQYIEGEYEYGANGWIVAVTEPGSRRPLLSSSPANGQYVLQDFTTGYKSFYPQTSSGKVSYYTTQVYSDTTKDYNRKKNLIEIYSDSSVFQYTGKALAQFEVYYHRSDSFSTDFEEEAGIRTENTRKAWHNFLGMDNDNRPRTGTKTGAQLIKTVFFSQAESAPSNPLYQLLAPLNFDIMEVPFLHSQELPKMVTTNGASGTVIRQYNYTLDAEKRPKSIRELIINQANEKVPNRSIHFNYKK